MKNKPYISILGQEGADIVHINDIIYIYSEERSVNFVLQDTKHEKTCICGIGKLEKILEETDLFVRCHNRYIINIDKLTCVNKSSLSLVLNNEIRLPISKTYRESFRDKLSALCIKLHK